MAIAVLGAGAVSSVDAQTPSTAPAGDVEGLLVRAIQFQGLDRIDEGYVRNQMRTRAGEPYRAAQVAEDVSRLYRTGRFQDVRATPQRVDGQVDLVVVLSERPLVQSIEVVGGEKYAAKDLLKGLEFAVGDPIDRFLINQGREQVERKYREDGHAFVEVTIDEEALRNEQRVVYQVVEGPRVKIREVRFEGNTAYPPQRLLKLINNTKTYIWILRKGQYDPEGAERDAANLQTFYREHGFLEAEVSYRSEFLDEARQRLRVVFVINEGVRYRVKEIRTVGNSVLTNEQVFGLMKLKAGDYFDAFKLKADVEAIVSEYGRIGHIYAQVSPTRVFAEEPEQVLVTLRIAEGGRFYFGRIEVNGNEFTQDKCVLRELKFYPEDVYDTSKTKAAEQRLKETQLFTEATITPVGTGPDVRDVTVEVKENPRTNNFLLGAGYGSDNGLVGNIVLENTNFDIADWPRNATEFFKGRSFRGAGQTARIQLEPGTEVLRFRLDFREPYLLDQPIGLSTGAYFFERDRGPYTEERLGLKWGFDHRFEEGILKNWTAGIGFRNEYVDINDVEFLAAREIREDEGDTYLSSVEPWLVHNTTDSVFNPTKGHKFRLGWEQYGVMGGDFFSSLTASYVQHWTVFTDAEDRKHVLSLRVSGGQIFGDAPVYERFYAGGIGSMRGFAFRGISPRSGWRDDAVGGEFTVLTGAEYTVPLYEDIIRGVGFLDMGTVERDFGISTWRASVGAGIRLTLPFFGTIPMEFDVAYPFAKDDDDDTQVFSFYIGLPFF